MPELPDLTVFAGNLHRRLSGKKTLAIECHTPTRLNVDAEELRKAVVGTVLEKVARWGKEVEFAFSGGAILRIHLMLAGRFVITGNPDGVADRVMTLRFEDGPALVVSDPKGLAKGALNPDSGAAPDALDVSADHLRKKAAERPRTTAKAFLIDQTVLRGIGNAYADEILWEARVSPKAAVGKIPGEVMDGLVAAMRKVLTDAVEKIRASDPEIIGGEIRDFLLIHHPNRRESPTGRPIVREKIASKTTYFTDEQVLY